MRSPKHINKFISGSSNNLHQLLDHCTRLQNLTRTVRELLPAPLNQHCQVANIRDQLLILHVDSSIWATVLHYQAPALLEHLTQRPGLEHISNIRTRVSPHYQRPSGVNPSHPKIPETTAALIGNLADSMLNPALKKALSRLARHSARSSEK